MTHNGLTTSDPTGFARLFGSLTLVESGPEPLLQVTGETFLNRKAMTASIAFTSEDY